MGENSAIQWTHHTFNPWVGCQRVSPGCVNCYAEAYDKRVGGAKLPDGSKSLRWGPTAPRVRTSAANWRKPLAWDAAAKVAGERHRVFCASLADVFEDRPELEPIRLDLLELIRITPNLDWLFLTKRPEAIQALLRAARRTFRTATPLHTWLTSWLDYNQPPPNVWLGTTVEDQQRANERIPALLSVPARVRFLSCEPLLEHVNLTGPWPLGAGENFGIDWVIIGGESGSKARSFHTEWARDLIQQCRAGGSAPFVKQMGSNAVGSGRDQLALLSMKDGHGGDPAEWPEDLRVREFPAVAP